MNKGFTLTHRHPNQTKSIGDVYPVVVDTNWNPRFDTIGLLMSDASMVRYLIPRDLASAILLFSN